MNLQVGFYFSNLHKVVAQSLLLLALILALFDANMSFTGLDPFVDDIKANVAFCRVTPSNFIKETIVVIFPIATYTNLNF